MTINFVEDIAEIMSEDDHAVKVVFSGEVFSGIFNMEYVGQEGGTVDIESANPVLYVDSAKVVDAEHGDEITVDKNVYVIVGKQPDGTGITVLVLSDE